jgi:hypothetical protein
MPAAVVVRTEGSTFGSGCVVTNCIRREVADVDGVGAR